MADFDPEDIIDMLEQDIADRLSGDDWISKARMKEDGTYVSIPVITEDLGNVDTMVSQAVYETSGICLKVQALEWDIQYKNVPGPYIEKINIVILGIENVPINRGTAGAPSPSGSLRKIKSVMLRVQELLHLWTPPSLSRAIVCGEVKLARIGSVEDGDDGVVQYVAMASVGAHISLSNVQQVDTPTIQATHGVVTLACTTPGASIWYTINGVNPSPRTGTVYTVPFTITNPCTVTARGYLEYSRVSNAATLAVDPSQ